MNRTSLLGRASFVSIVALAALAVAAPAQEKLPPGAKLVKLEAKPGAVELKNPYAYSQLLLSGQLATGETVDVTRMAKLEVPSVVKVSATGQVRPLADGSGVVKATVEGQSISIPVKVSGQKETYSVSFVRDVMPTLSRLGCNAGTCHGSQNGKNGFKLSLRGYDPLFDHRSLTDDLAGRRFNRAAPDASLMLLKPAGAVPHVGSVLTSPGEPYYDMLRAWIAAGVKLDLDSPRVASVDVFPKSPTIPLLGMKQQMAVLATFTDGSVREVSAEAFIESSNTEVATADKTGLVTAVRRGEATVMVRYEGSYAATTLVSMGDRSGFAWKDMPENNWIDGLVYEKLKSVKVLPSELCSDGDFIRRITIDLVGLPPQPEDVRAFLADPRPTRVKREALIDKLVGSAEFVEHWTNKWADLMQVNRKFLGEKGAAALRGWIRQAIASNMPYDKFVNEILTATGSTVENPPAAYFKVLREPDTVMENTTQLFLAIRFNCNKCHDHPFERWTQDQYYQLAAFFAQVQRKEDPKFKGQRIGGSAVEGAAPLVEIIADQNAGDMKHLRTGAISPPTFPYKHKDTVPATAKRREQLAHWVTSKDNPYFAKSYVNRLWAYMLGVGIIEPIDDIRAGNPPSNAKLLDRLTNEFIASGFNVQELLKTICKSRTYQLSVETNKWNADDEINYAHALARRLPAEVLYDAIHRVTGSTTRLPGLPAGARAAQLLDSSIELPGGFLELFGKPPRESACECERSGSMMLGPVLGLVNGPILADAIKDPSNRITRLSAEIKDDRKLVEEIFLAVLSRLPSSAELEFGLKAMQGSDAEFKRLQDEHAKLQAELGGYEKQLPVKQIAWEKELQQKPAWTTLDATAAVSAGGAVLTKQPDGSILVTGKNPFPEKYTVTATTKLTNITGIRLEVLTDPSLPTRGPGRAPNGNFVLNEFRVNAQAVGATTKADKVALARATADFSQEGYPVQNAIDNNNVTGWAIVPETGKDHVAIFEIRKPIANPNGTTLTIELDQQFAGKDHNIGKFRLSVTSAKKPISLSGPPDAITKVLAIEAAKRTPPQQAELAAYFQSSDKELARLRQAVADFAKPTDKRLIGAQDLAWSLINTPAFLFNH